MSTLANPSVVEQLEHEWRQLTAARVAATLPDWRDRKPPLRRFDSPQRLLAVLHAAPAAETDPPLLALLELARSEQLAGRVVLQALLPALRAQARRIIAPGRAQDEVWELLLYCAWEAISGYPLARRRLHVARKLYFETLHHTSRRLQPPHWRHPAPAGPVDESTDGEPEAAPSEPAETLLLAAIEAGLLEPDSAELILLTRIDGIPLRLLARHLGTGYDALRKRRQRGEHALRQLLTAGRDVPDRPRFALASYETAVPPRTRQLAHTILAPTGEAAIAEAA